MAKRCQKPHFILCRTYTNELSGSAKPSRVIRRRVPPGKQMKNKYAMKYLKKIHFPLCAPLRPIAVALLVFNAASDSKGRTWGLEGGLFWWLVGGVGAGITLFVILIVVVKVSLTTSFVIAAVPVTLCLAYIFGLRQGKPPGYDRDCFEYLI